MKAAGGEHVNWNRMKCHVSHKSPGVSLRCRDVNVTPPSLKLSCVTKAQKTRYIIRKAEKGLENQKDFVLATEQTCISLPT